MIRSCTVLLMSLVLGAGACGSDGVVVGQTNGSSATDMGTTTMPSPSGGESCPLVGAYVECKDDDDLSGRRYCDDIDGALQWGPCLSMRQCDLLDASGCTACTLVDGVPTLVDGPECEDSWGTPVCPECHPAEECACADDCWSERPRPGGVVPRRHAPMHQ